jgi:hypothetical protein
MKTATPSVSVEKLWNKTRNINQLKPALFRPQKGVCTAATIGRSGVTRREHDVDTLPIVADDTRFTAQLLALACMPPIQR